MAASQIQPIDEKARNVLISMNPKSGSSNRQNLVTQLAQQLTQYDLIVETIDDIERLCELANRLLESGQLRTVVSAGGDGTASLLANRLPSAVPFTVFPLGTANLLAKYLGATLDPRQTAAAIANGKTITLDAGRANDRLFLVVASCGFDADVVQRIHASRKGHISYWSYGMPIIRSIWKYRFPKMRFVADGVKLDSARWAFVFNLPQYAMDLRFIETADANDGLLDVCTFRDGGFFHGLFYFFAVLFRRHRSISAARFKRFKQLAIESDSRVPIELDGDPAGHLPVKISVVPERVRFVVADNWLEPIQQSLGPA